MALSILLPQLEQGPLFDSSRNPTSGVYTYWASSVQKSTIKVFRNPSDPSLGADGMIQILPSYALSATCYAYNGQVFTLTDATGAVSDAPRGMQSAARIPASFPDGTSNTIIFAEKYASCGEDAIGAYTGSRILGGSAAFMDGICPFEPGFALYFKNTGCDQGPRALGPGSKFQVRPRHNTTECKWWLTQTARSGGILVGLADGSVRNIGPGISGSTWWAACTPDGGEVLGSDWDN
jgi:hypothetical protein